MPRFLVFVATFALATPAVALAQLTSHQALDRRSLADPRWQPHGEHVAVTVSEPPKGTGRERHIWLADAATSTARQITASAKSEWSPRWSPDGRTLAFLSDRGERTQIHLLSMDGGEATPLTELKSRIGAFEWSPDGRRIALLAPEPRSAAADQKVKDKDDALVADDSSQYDRVWIVDVATRQVRQVTHAPWRVSDVAWTPDGARLVVVATDHPERDEYTNRIMSLSLRAKDSAAALTPIAAPRGPFGAPQISPDGSQLAWVGARVDGPTPHDLYVAPLGGGAPGRNLTAALDRPVRSFGWRHDGSLVALVQDGFTTRLVTIDANARVAPLASTPVHPTSVDVSDGGDVAFVGERTTQPQELWIMRRGGAAMQVTHVNDAARAVATVAPQLIHWKAPDGLAVEGALLLPARAERPLPLVVVVHGGPAGAWQDAFEAWGQLLVARGYAVLYPNPRGSTGYGEKFLEANRADWGGADYKDILAGVDDLIVRKIADPDKLGIGGWSYGGYMSEWAITQTTRFKAAIAGAGLSDLASEFGTEGNPAYDEWYFGTPYERPAGFAKSSPITYIAKARTPTLILQGENDVTDPIGQSQQLYRALKRYHVPAELVLYPREGHGLVEEKHLVDRLDRVVAWYERWVR